MIAGVTDLRKYPVATFAMAALATLTLVIGASSAYAGDRYRAEIIILERIVEPEKLTENMSGQEVEPTPDISKALWVNPQNGGARSSLKQADSLYLSNAAARLENSGRFRILAKTGWYQDFPQNYRGERLAVAIGDWLPQAQQRNVEGYIKIDRQRYLHVEAHLNHWQDSAAPTGADTQSSMNSDAQVDTDSGAQMATDSGAQSPMGLGVQASMNSDIDTSPELLTWIRETRRMRSSEIHFLDSPTIGVLVYFAKIKD